MSRPAGAAPVAAASIQAPQLGVGAAGGGSSRGGYNAPASSSAAAGTPGGVVASTFEAAWLDALPVVGDMLQQAWEEGVGMGAGPAGAAGLL